MPSRLPLGPGLLALWLVTAAFSIQPVATPRPTPTPTRQPTPAPRPTPTPTPAAITLSDGVVVAGTLITVGGTGFGAERQVTIYFDGPETAIGTAGADVQGTFRQDVLVPEATSAGMHVVCALRLQQPVCLPLQVLAAATPALAAPPPSQGDPPAAAASIRPPSPLALLAVAPVIGLLAALAMLRRRRRLARALRPGQPWTPPGS